jgi:hypothetical protein
MRVRFSDQSLPSINSSLSFDPERALSPQSDTIQVEHQIVHEVLRSRAKARSEARRDSSQITPSKRGRGRPRSTSRPSEPERQSKRARVITDRAQGLD